MELYTRRSWWKIILALAALVIVLVTLYYSNYLARHFQEREKERMEYFALALKSLFEDQELLFEVDEGTQAWEILNDRDYGPANKIIEDVKRDMPIILVDENGEVYEAHNFGKKGNDPDYIQGELEKIKLNGYPPIEGEGYASEIYYKNSRFIPLLQWFPILQIFMLLSFVLLGYIGFSNSRKAEQNRVWVGMAKETAHQLGTPISALMGWVEHLKFLFQDDNDEEKDMVLKELTKDVDRLKLVADRFSKIGSDPEMSITSVESLISHVEQYMSQRKPRKVTMNFPRGYHKELKVKANAPLIEWVFENLIRNSIDAMEGSGEINVSLALEKNQVCIDFSDTGKGIPPGKWKTIFQPGYTTKNRGWGLGLSLAKRIVQEYHDGKIFVKKSELNEGTTITVKLPEAF